MKLSNCRKPQRQQETALCRITESQKHKLFAGIAATLLFTGMFVLSTTYASEIAIVMLGSSGFINTSDISGSLVVIGNRILAANGESIVLKGMGYTYFVNNDYAYNGEWVMSDGSVPWNTWSTTGVQDLLDFMQASNANVVRVFMTVEYWLQNTGDFQDHIKYFVTQAANRGIYTVLTFWNTGGAMEMPQGVHPWQDGNTFIRSSTDFVDLWGNVSTTLKNYPSVIFELFNEPTGNEAEWFSVAQQCITRIRSVGAMQPIVIQYHYQINYDFSQGWHFGMDWVFNNPLNDSAGNLIYSAHLYSGTYYGFYNYPDTMVTDYASIDFALDQCRVYDVAAIHPVFIGEIGNNLWDSTLENGVRAQDVYYNNTLSLFDQHGIGYAAFAAPPWTSATQWGLVQNGVANYTLNSAGVVLVSHLGGVNYKDWLNARA